MALYTFHAPRTADAVAIAPVDLVAIKDGFCWPALFIPLIWTIYRRLWLVLLLLLAAWLIVQGVGAVGGGPAAVVLYLLGRLYYALEANGLRRWTLERNGWWLVGIAEGRTVEEAERRFFAEWTADAERPAPSPPTPPETPRPQTFGTPGGWKSAPRGPRVVGLFPTPETPR